jgi:hypothetical protein
MNLHLRIFCLFLFLVTAEASAQECTHAITYCDVATNTILQTRTDSLCWEYVNHCDSTLYTLKNGDTTAAFPITRFEMTDSSFILDLVLDFDVQTRAEFLFGEDKMIVASPEWGFFMIETARHRLCPPVSVDRVHGDATPDFGTLMIIHEPYNAKGFIVDAEASDNVAVPFCTELEKKPDIRLFIEPLENGLFEVHYKYRESTDFIVEIMPIYLVNGFAGVALNQEVFPTRPDNDFMQTNSFPASTDERDVVRACLTAEGKRVYIF